MFPFGFIKMKPVTETFICGFILFNFMVKTKKNTDKMFWKVIAISFMVLFCVIIISGLIRLYHSEPYRTAAQPFQVDLAKKVVAQDLANAGENISDYKVQLSDARKFPRDGTDKSLIQVSLYKNSKRHLYLIDADSGEIVMHSETMFYGWMENQSQEIPMPNARPSPFWERRQEGK